MNAVAIIDYGMCNLDSVARAVEDCGGTPVVTSKRVVIEQASHIILPGVGAFSDAMDNIMRLMLYDVLRKAVLENRIPFLGICLGMQLMASFGEEGGFCSGLDIIPGSVRQMVPNIARHERLPHIGWNEVNPLCGEDIFKDIRIGSDFYFVHSYHYCCDDQYVLARTPYCGGFVSAIKKDNAYGVQFHPEKSQDVGFKLLNNFLVK